ncbi:MAG: EpsD family peptidyl-prolyl cis-trans isomerase [Burkholderiales bacterium]|nr:EpsD family peptidyl-prolyl cis-trans isomerase [Burkholderiales bacterium]
MNPKTQTTPRLARGRLTLAAVALASTTLMLAACGDKKDPAATQTAARVNKDEITVHQINFMLQQQRGLRQDQAEAASHQILERLIDQDLAVQKADDQKLDRDPRVVQQLEAARREVLARAYLEKVGEGAAKPTQQEIQKYYEDKPALFSDRRIYNLQEISIEARPDQIPQLRERLTTSKNVADFIEYLKSQNIKFAGNQAVRAAEQLPMASLDAIARMKDGQAMVTDTPTGVQVLLLAGSRSQPVSIDQAKPAIEQYLLNERKRKLIEDEMKSLRAAAKIEYVGRFAPAASGAAAGASAAQAAPLESPAAPASPGLSSSDITKGMGLK